MRRILTHAEQQREHGEARKVADRWRQRRRRIWNGPLRVATILWALALLAGVGLFAVLRVFNRAVRSFNGL